MEWVDIGQLLIAAIGGGGITKLIDLYRSRGITQYKAWKEAYDALEKDFQEMHTQLIALTHKVRDLETHVSGLEAENEALKKKLKKYEQNGT